MIKLPLHYLLPEVKGVPVLMYHNVSEDAAGPLNITPKQLRLHLSFLYAMGYRALGLGEFIAMAKGKRPVDYRSFLLSFDDGYLNQCQLAYPIIRFFNFKATFFINGRYLDHPDTGSSVIERKAAVADLETLDPEVIQLALHSYQHHHFGSMTADQVKGDLEQNMAAFERSGLPFYKTLAYPYGGRPAGRNKAVLRSWMKDTGIHAAFRIGNKPCVLPADDLYELKRIDVLGTDTVETLAIKLRKGKLKPF